MKNRIIRDTLLLTAMQLVLDSAAIVLNSYITGNLGASAIGIFSLMGSFLGLAGILSNGNAFLCTSRLISEEIGRKNGCPERILGHGIKLCLMLCTCVSALIFVFAEPVGERFFSGADMTAAIRLMPIALFSGAVSSCLKGYFNAMRKASRAAVGDIFEFAVRAAVIVALTTIFTERDQASVCRILVIAMISGNCASLLFMTVLYLSTEKNGQGRGTLDFRGYAALAFPIMGGGMLTAILSSANDALVPMCLRQFGDSREQALAQFGIFEAIVIPTLFFPSVVLCSMSGLIVTESARASASGNRERIRSIAARLISCTTAYSILAAAVIMRFGDDIGQLLDGGIEAGKMIRAIAPVIPFIYLEIVLEAMIKGLGEQKFSSLNYLAEYVIRISCLLVFVPFTGFYGIAVSYYASNIFGNIMRLVKIFKITGLLKLRVKSSDSGETCFASPERGGARRAEGF